MATYTRHTKNVRSREIAYESEVLKADTNFVRDKNNQTEYEFTKRKFTANPSTRGAYGE